MDHVLAMFRKLREGLTASRSMDAFTITVYEESVDACLEAENYAELHKSLSHLLQDVYPNCIKGDPVNDVVKRRDEMAAYYLLYRICYAKASSQKTLYGPPQEILSFLSSLPLDIRKSSRVQGAVRVWESLVLDVDYVSLARQWKDASLQEKRLIKVCASDAFCR